MLTIEAGNVFFERTGELAGKRKIADLGPKGAVLVPSTEAPILYSVTPRGWTVIVTAVLPKESDFISTDLRVHILDPQRQEKTTTDTYEFLGTFHAGQIFGTESEFVQISTTGPHSYAVRTLVWLLRANGLPMLLMDVPGLLDHIQVPAPGRPGGLWINYEMYDGVHPETKGHKQEFWMWDEDRRQLIQEKLR